MLKDLEKKFENYLGISVEIKLTENTTTLIKVAKKIDKFIIRIHKGFLFAGENVLEDILSFIKTGNKNTPNLKNFIRTNPDLFKKKEGKFKLVTKGNNYDLKEIFNFLNKKYFENSIKSHITWGKIKKGLVKKRILGNYDPINDVIRINPILDKSTVPSYYIHYVVYHEMLHAFLKKIGKRWHGKEFKELEKKFEYYKEAIEWEKRR